MKESDKKELESKRRAWKDGKITRDEFSAWLLDANESGKVDDATYDEIDEEINIDIFSGADA